MMIAGVAITKVEELKWRGVEGGVGIGDGEFAFEGEFYGNE